jgi:hypothetical protein
MLVSIAWFVPTASSAAIMLLPHCSAANFSSALQTRAWLPLFVASRSLRTRASDCQAGPPFRAASLRLSGSVGASSCAACTLRSARTFKSIQTPTPVGRFKQRLGCTFSPWMLCAKSCRSPYLAMIPNRNNTKVTRQCDLCAVYHSNPESLAIGDPAISKPGKRGPPRQRPHFKLTR